MKLNYKRTFFAGLAFMSICSFWSVYDSVIPLMLKGTFGIGDTVSGVVMALDNVLALFMLPLFGVLSDKTHTRLGRRVPYVIGGTLGAVVMMVLIPLADNISNIALFFVALGLVLVSMATYRSPAVAIMPEITPKPLRSRANAVINVMGTAGGIFALLYMKKLIPKDTVKPDYMPVFLVTAGFMALCVVALVLTTNEPKLAAKARAEEEAAGIHDEPEQLDAHGHEVDMPKDVRRSFYLILISIALWFMGYNAVTTAFSKYATFYLGMEGGGFTLPLLVAQASAVIAYLPTGIFASRYGRKKTIMAGVVLLAAAFLGASFLTHYSAVMIVFLGMAGVGWAAIVVNSFPMIWEMSRGTNIGKYTGYYYTVSMAAQIVTPILSGAVLEFLGYKYLFPYAVVFVAAAFFTMMGVKHGDSRPDAPKSKLEAFDVND